MDIETAASLVTLAASLLVAFLVSHKVVTQDAVEDKLMIAASAVQAAEEAFPVGSAGRDKFEYAVGHLLTRFRIDRDEAEMLVNAAVTGLRNAGGKS